MLKITPSLLDTDYFYRKSDYKSREDYMKTLRCEKTEQNESMLKGIKFENDCCNYENTSFENGEKEEYIQTCETVFNLIKDGVFQTKLTKEILVNGVTYKLVGKTDVIIADRVIDIKFSKSYDLNKYFYSAQWGAYLFLTELNKMQYVVSAGRGIYIEEYNLSKEQAEQIMKSKIRNFIETLKYDEEAYLTYERNWNV